MASEPFMELAQSHPCYDANAHNRIGRIHLPVAPKCNIACRFCDRKISPYYHTSRPGLAHSLLQPEDAIFVVENAIEKNPQIEVVGISGPGEPLYNDETYKTLKIVSENFPFLKLCICTNGLLLPEKTKILRELGVKSLTITINAVDPKIASKLSSFSIVEGKKVRGLEGARLLVNRQLKGLEIAAELGFLIKINTVLIPELNLTHIKDIAYEVQKRGAYLLNIMPLIPLGKFDNLKAPTCEELR
ncbi:MAG: radical SAM protein [Thermoplasmata archaeon]|nr:MAG: radical SAM protein [Thermoplasmata archaeon]